MDNTQRQKNDFSWFLRNYNNLYQRYGHSFLVIKDNHILGSYTNTTEALRETLKSEEIGTFIIQECNGDESGYTNYISSWELV